MLGEGIGRAEVPSDLASGDPCFGAPWRTLSLVLEGNSQSRWHQEAAETQRCMTLPPASGEAVGGEKAWLPGHSVALVKLGALGVPERMGEGGWASGKAAGDVESLTGLTPPHPPTSCHLSFPFWRGGSPCLPCRAAAGAS